MFEEFIKTWIRQSVCGWNVQKNQGCASLFQTPPYQKGFFLVLRDADGFWDGSSQADVVFDTSLSRVWQQEEVTERRIPNIFTQLLARLSQICSAEWMGGGNFLTLIWCWKTQLSWRAAIGVASQGCFFLGWAKRWPWKEDFRLVWENSGRNFLLTPCSIPVESGKHFQVLPRLKSAGIASLHVLLTEHSQMSSSLGMSGFSGFIWAPIQQFKEWMWMQQLGIIRAALSTADSRGILHPRNPSAVPRGGGRGKKEKISGATQRLCHSKRQILNY